MDGVILINKEKGYTSNDVVQIVKKTLCEKVGHSGTLDPLATGVLPLLVGKGTLCSKYLINHDKIYTATIKLGIKTDTADKEGKVIEERKVDEIILNRKHIEDILETFKGEQEQVPPMYSAIKVNGKKLYEYARNEEKIEVKPRKIKIYDIKLINIDKEKKEITYNVSCSKGTYIRTLCENIAEKLDSIGYMKELNREKVGIFGIEKSIKIDELKENYKDKECIDENFISIENLFKDKNEIVLDLNKIKLFLNGVKLSYNIKDDIYRIYDEKNDFIGIGIVKSNLLKRDIIL